jgi:hypothetical protein
MFKLKYALITILSILFFMIYSNLNSVIILVHGSFAAQMSWHQPGGRFYQELEKIAQKQNQPLVSFAWSGIPTEIDIVKGAENLAKLILSYPIDEKITLIGHSHGGNVINFASQLLFDPIEDLMANQTSQELEQEISQIIAQAYENLFPQQKHFSEKLNEYLKAKKLKQNLPPSLKLLRTRNKQVQIAIKNIRILQKQKQTRIIKKTCNKKYLIDKVYLLGTPVDPQRFHPQLKVINHVLNFYSWADRIQTVAGLFKRTYPQHDRISNIEITINNKQPTHMQMHDPIIAPWLLLIPDALKNVGFEKFNYGKNAKINFYDSGVFLDLTQESKSIKYLRKSPS